MPSLPNTLLIVCLLLAGRGATAPPVDDGCDARLLISTTWQRVYQSPDIRLYQRQTNDDAPPQAAALVHWNADPQTLYRMVWRYDRFADFVPNVRQSDILKRGEHSVWVYQQLNLPGPIRNRHYVLESTDHDSDPASGHYRVEWQLSNRFALPAGSRAIAPAVFSGCWDIRKASGQGLDAVYRIVLDPGGLLPRWMVERAMRRYLIDLMAALEKRLQQPSGGE